MSAFATVSGTGPFHQSQLSNCYNQPNAAILMKGDICPTDPNHSALQWRCSPARRHGAFDMGFLTFSCGPIFCNTDACRAASRQLPAASAWAEPPSRFRLLPLMRDASAKGIAWLAVVVLLVTSSAPGQSQHSGRISRLNYFLEDLYICKHKASGVLVMWQ